ncbi:hypothetical protein HGO34_15665 [Agrobacterium vitis]|uniref:hypothetical protein n=1 Tax=Agrobacterium vitis TaxID=373 RepID=UPI001F20A3CC|nr:hypothetical protein [Agrobacterium vitis]MCF1498938.1 hypothetical protein [Allorhizobium sp. Av2]MCM2441159.1 hypothetical protein [Agrobacterium vitis]
MTQETPLQTAITDAINRNVASDKVQELIEKKTQGLIAEVIDDAFRSYSEFGKELRAMVAESLKLPEGHRLDMPSFGQTIMTALKASMDETIGDLLNQKLKAQMDEILSIAPKELKLSQVVEKLVEDAKESRLYHSHDRVTCRVERTDGTMSEWCDIYLDRNRTEAPKDCQARLTVTGDGKIFRMVIDGRDASKTIHFGAYSEWEKLLFSAFACGSTLIIDEDNVSTSLDDY